MNPFSNAPLVAIGLAALLSTAPKGALAEPVRVVSTIGMIADIVAGVGGDCAQVDTLVPPGADPHLFRLRPSDAQRLVDAQVVFFLGLNLEGKLGDVLSNLPRDRQLVELSRSIPEDLLLFEDGAPDPHVWMDPSLWALALPEIVSVLGQERPDCADAIQVRGRVLGDQLAALDRWTADTLATIPENRRILVTAHDAFGYLAHAHGLRQEAIQGFSTESEAAVADIRAVAQVVLESGVPAVFVETTINPRTVQALVEAVTAAGGQVAVGAPLHSDSMGPEGTAEGTYIGMIRANVIAIAKGLGGTPAPWTEALADWADRWNVAP